MGQLQGIQCRVHLLLQAQGEEDRNLRFVLKEGEQGINTSSDANIRWISGILGSSTSDGSWQRKRDDRMGSLLRSLPAPVVAGQTSPAGKQAIMGVNQ